MSSFLDCLILGFYDYPFEDYVNMLRSIGPQSGAYHDLSLAYIDYEGRPLRALDVMTKFYCERNPGTGRPFHNSDFLSPAVAYLTTYLDRRGFHVDFVNLPHLETEKLRRALEQPVRAVAITTTLYVSPHPILALIAEIRRYNPDVKIIVGGPYISNQAHLLDHNDLRVLLQYLGADIYVLCREGEATLASLISCLQKGVPLDLVPNLAFWGRNGSFNCTPRMEESNSLTEYVMDYRMFDKSTVGQFLSIQTAKSCPFACAYCGFPERAGEYRFLDVHNVEKQLDAIVGIGTVTTLSFLDDTFNVPKGRFKDIMRMMIRNNYSLKWNCFYRVDQGDDEAIDLMAEAGCEGVFLGVESGSDQMLTLMNKSARRKHYIHAIPKLHAAGISTYASLIIGFPGETSETVKETMTFLEETAPEYYRAQLWYADPLTPILKKRHEHGLSGEGFNWNHRTMNVFDACEWITKIFLTVRSSEWLPQFGFEQWSIFYLQRKGMSRRQIRSFLGCFNAIVRHRIVSGNCDPPSGLISALRASCEFDNEQIYRHRA